MVECVICFEPMIDGVGMTSCGHHFHFRCIEKWRRNCPICRSSDMNVTLVVADLLQTSSDSEQKDSSSDKKQGTSDSTQEVASSDNEQVESDEDSYTYDDSSLEEEEEEETPPSLPVESIVDMTASLNLSTATAESPYQARSQEEEELLCPFGRLILRLQRTLRLQPIDFGWKR
eukprot:scaffold10540_cov84-Skeletonema_dohrnii-CCMP3373.AAC.2